MSLGDSLDSLVTNTVTLNRRAKGTYVKGVYVLGVLTVIPGITMVVQPAYNLNRVVGGADLSAKADNQKAADVRVCYTSTELKTISDTTDPDVITDLESSSWTVTRVERWELSGDVHYRCILSKVTGGAS